MSPRQLKTWNKFQRNVSARLRELRSLHGNTHAEFGSKFGVTGGTSIRWCSGTTLPDLPVLLDIQKTFGLPPSFFFEV